MSKIAQLEQQNNNADKKKYELIVSQLQMVNESLFNESYIILKNNKTGKTWQSPYFYFKMFQVWQIQIDCPILELQLFMKIKSSHKKIAEDELIQGTDTLYLKQLANPKNKFCVLRYELRQFKEQLKQKKSNHFLHSSNIFDSYINQDDHDAKKPHKNFDDEKVGFNGDISIISSQQNITKDKIKNEPIQSQLGKKNNKQNSEQDDERRRFANLNDSTTSFIQQFLKSIPDDENGKPPTTPRNKNQPNQQLQKIKQQLVEECDEEFITTGQKWYTQKFNKKNLKIRKKKYSLPKNIQPQLQLNPRNIKVNQFNTPELLQNQAIVKQLTDMSVQENIKLKTIQFSLTVDGGESKKLYEISRNDVHTSSLWYTAISIPNEGTVMVQCLTQEDGELNGCLGSNQLKKGQCILYDTEGNSVCNFAFKCKSICNYIVQTHQLLSQANNQQSSQKEDNNQSIINKQKQQENENKQGNKETLNSQNIPNSNDIQQNKYIDNFQPRQSVENKNAQDLDKKRQNLQNINNQNNQKQPQQNKTQNQVINLKGSKLTSKDSKQVSRNQIYERIVNLQINKPIKNLNKQEKNQMNQNYNQNQKQKTKQNVQQKQSKPQNRNDNQKQMSESIINKYLQKQSQQNFQQNYPKTKRQSDEQKLLIFKQNTRKKKSNLSSRLKKFSQIDVQQDGKYYQNSPSSNNRQRQDFYSKNKQSIPQFKLHHTDQVNFGNSFSIDKFQHRDQNNIQQNNSNYKQSNFAPLREDKNKRMSYRQQSNFSEDIRRQNLNETIFSSIVVDKNKIGFKIQSIMLTLNAINYNSKIIKMQIQNNSFFTQTSKSLYVSKWQGKGYFFPSVTKFSILYISLIEQNQTNQMVTGNCKFHLSLMSVDKANYSMYCEQFLRDQNENQMGRVIINYRIINKNLRKIQNRYSQKDRYTFMEKMVTVDHATMQSQLTNERSPRKKTTRISTEGSSRSIDSRSVIYKKKNLINIGNSQYSINQNILSRYKKPPLSKRKYQGGNTLIPKANRFVQQKISRIKKYEPGPGSYEMSSMFDRHATPL